MGTGGYYEQIAPVIDQWLAIHLLFFPVLALLAVSLALLVADYEGPVATIARLGIVTFAVFYLGIEAVAGIATGVIVKAAGTLPAAQQDGVAAVITTLFTHPIVGGGTFSAFVVLAMFGYIVAVVAIAVVLGREGAPKVPLLLVVASSLGIVSHGFPTGVIGMLLLFAGVAWLELRWDASNSPY